MDHRPMTCLPKILPCRLHRFHALEFTDYQLSFARLTLKSLLNLVYPLTPKTLLLFLNPSYYASIRL